MSLDTHRDFLVTTVLPNYGTLGGIAFAHVQGSLVLSYTDESDLDVIVVWDMTEVPIGREALGLDERERKFPEVIDYRDIHLDRFVVDGQDYKGIYWTGDKWRRAAMQRYDFDPRAIGLYDLLWSPHAPAERRLEALEELTEVALAEARA